MMTGVCGHRTHQLSNPLNLGFLKIFKNRKKSKSLKCWAYCPVCTHIPAFAQNRCFGPWRPPKSLGRSIFSLCCLWQKIVVAQNLGDWKIFFGFSQNMLFSTREQYPLNQRLGVRAYHLSNIRRPPRNDDRCLRTSDTPIKQSAYPWFFENLQKLKKIQIT